MSNGRAKPNPKIDLAAGAAHEGDEPSDAADIVVLEDAPVSAIEHKPSRRTN